MTTQDKVNEFNDSAFTNGMKFKMKKELRLALFAEAAKQGISPPKLLTKLLEEKLLTNLNGDINEEHGSTGR